MEVKIKLGLLLSLIAPLVITSLYLTVTRWPSRWFTETSDYSALGFSILVGVFGITMFPWSVTKKFISVIFYTPVAIVFIGYYALSFVCIVFGDCL
jgi:hypothetical protein